MAKKEDTRNLFQRPGSSRYYVKVVRDGKCVIRSTGTENLEAAQAFRDRMLLPNKLEDEKSAAEAAVSLVNGATDRLEKELKRREDELSALTLFHGWQAYLDQANRPDSGPVTLEQYRAWYERFASWMETAHPEVKEMRHVSQEIADKYAGHLQKQVSATTFNRHVNTLTLVWRTLEKTARLTTNPWKQITRKKFVAHSRRELTVEELTRIITAAQGEMKVLIALGIYTGLRLGDCASLRWDGIDMVRRIITCIPMKTARRTQKRVMVPIHPTLYSLLDAVPSSSRKGYLLPKAHDRYLQFNAALAKDVTRLFDSCDIKTSAKVDGAKRNRPDCGFHSLRHTFVSLCAAGGVSQSVVQSLVGHGSPAMTAHYTHIGTETARAAIGALPNVTQTIEQVKPIIETTSTLEEVMTKLETLKKSELKKVASRCKELMK
jgi:integrase